MRMEIRILDHAVRNLITVRNTKARLQKYNCICGASIYRKIATNDRKKLSREIRRDKDLQNEVEC